ncbi:hypothetical protein SUGI_0601500 [Cryptomeria japonica]|uniref:squamosa promoter-binding-like protein 6 n=1 Tax=Cryptomeria japonica TaxID=3369 RepID=UPI00241481B2|nr:squamosa promoter-binding-like protein 6 [Cryptomeria japonica]GLJ30398.1 hypothetical protein SUGI_0601500 [Cryptomeria japonica]
MDTNSVNQGGSHDHCWASSKMQQEWQVWEGMGIYGHERLPVAEWAAGSEEGGYIGKEYFRGSMDQVSSDNAMVGNLSEVVMEKNFNSNNKTQFSLEEKLSPVKSEGNGFKGWLADGSSNGGNGFLGHGTNMLVEGTNGSYHGGRNVSVSVHHDGRYNSKVVKDVQGDSLTCLKLGKRQYYEDSANLGKGIPVSFSVTNSVYKKPRSLASSNAHPPRCQVEGCNACLANAKDYHRRHKVCEMHSKTAKVIVMGTEQRFCQQCSRFHAIAEFDDTKRSCRRRLAGHNERRRKSSSDSLHNSTTQDEKRLMGVQGERYELGRYNLPYMSSSCGRALSLLSSQHQWLNSSSCSTLPSRSSASASALALRELIAENRAQGLSRYSDDSPYQRANGVTVMVHPLSIQENEEKCRLMPGLRSLENHGKVNDGEVEKKNAVGVTGNPIVVRPTLDLMQQSDSSFALQSGKSNNKSSSSASSSSEDCEIWKSLEGTHIS